MKEIRRKHFRFPAYDDELGVKLTNDKKRVLFDGQEDLLTEQNQSPFEQMKEFHFTNTNTEKIRRKRRATNGLKSAPRKGNLEKHKGKLPDYTGHYQSEITSTGRKNFLVIPLVLSDKVKQGQSPSILHETHLLTRRCGSVLILFLNMYPHRLSQTLEKAKFLRII